MNLAFGVIVVGDEILLGRRKDRHFPHAIEALAARGESLAWCHYAGDELDPLAALLARTLAEGATVFCFGGIGATPDDRTRAAAAAASGRPLLRHPGAAALIEERFGDGAYPNRVRMADLPEGAALIPNPVNRIPGFSVERHFFLPGFPEMAWPMLDWVLDEVLRLPRRESPTVVDSLVVIGAGETQMLDLMEQVVAALPGARLFSLPSAGGGARRIELGLRGSAADVARGMTMLRDGLAARGIDYGPAISATDSTSRRNGPA